MLCLTCGYPLGSAQETDKEEAHEGRVGGYCGSKRGPSDLEADPENGGRSAAKGELRPVSHRGHARTYRAPQKAVTGLLFAASLFAAEPSTRPRTVSASEIFNVNCALYYSTIIELPKGEEITEVSAGDQKLWGVDYGGRYIFVKPKIDHPGRFTNVNAVAASGNVYSFTVREVSADKNASADLKVVVEQSDTDALKNIQHPQFVRADLVEDLKKSLAQKTDELAQAKHTAVAQAIKNQHHEYVWKQGKESDSFGLKAIWDDGKQTYIEAISQNAPALYEVRDGKNSSLVNYVLENGKYVVDHVMEIGELRAGKTKLEFRREKTLI